MLAWQSIVEDYKNNRITLDNLMAKQASASLEEARNILQRMIRETYKWVLAPVQHASGKGLSDIEWEAFPINANAQNLVLEIERVLKDNELLISEWSPIHLHKILQQWFWRDGQTETGALDVWQKSCQYLYLPRLKDDTVYRSTLAAGVASKDFFGVAQGKDGEKYLGFIYDRATTPIVDEALLLIEPKCAAAYAEARMREQEAARVERQGSLGNIDTGSSASASASGSEEQEGASSIEPSAVQEKRAYYGTVELDTLRAKLQFSDIIDEVVQQFTTRPGVKVRIKVDIQAESATGFDDGLQRAVKENTKVLKFDQSEFE